VVAKKIQDQIRNFLTKKNILADRRLMIFLFFVVLSTIFWLLNQLEEEYETKISLPVRYTDFPSDKILVNDLPEYFDLTVKAHGFKLLEYKISNKFLPYSINVNSLTLRIHSESDYVKLYALTRLIKDDVEKKLSSELQIISIKPDTLYFNFAERIFKKVPVVSQLNAVPATQYMIQDKIFFNPDSITISGANPIIDTIHQVYTEKKDLLDLDSEFNKEIQLQKIKNVDFSEDEIDVTIKVEKFTEGTQNIKLNVINVPDSIVLRTFPNRVSVSYFVALSHYDKVLPQLFEAIVDYNKIESQNNKLDVQIVNQPDYIKSLRYSPRSVEYIIEKK